MDLPVTYSEAKSFIGTLALTQPRILAMFIVLPLFNSQLVPGLIRFGIAGALGLCAAPAIQAEVSQLQLGAVPLFMLIMKEAFFGFVLGPQAGLGALLQLQGDAPAFVGFDGGHQDPGNVPALVADRAVGQVQPQRGLL